MSMRDECMQLIDGIDPHLRKSKRHSEDGTMSPCRVMTAACIHALVMKLAEPAKKKLAKLKLAAKKKLAKPKLSAKMKLAEPAKKKLAEPVKIQGTTITILKPRLNKV